MAVLFVQSTGLEGTTLGTVMARQFPGCNPTTVHPPWLTGHPCPLPRHSLILTSPPPPPFHILPSRSCILPSLTLPRPHPPRILPCLDLLAG